MFVMTGVRLVDSGAVALISGVFAISAVVLNQIAELAKRRLTRRSYLLEQREAACTNWLQAATRLGRLVFGGQTNGSGAAPAIRSDIYDEELNKAWAGLRLFGDEKSYNRARACIAHLLEVEKGNTSDPSLEQFTRLYMRTLEAMRRDIGSNRALERLDNAGTGFGIPSDAGINVPRWRRLLRQRNWRADLSD